MSKMGQAIFEMQEDAREMSREQFIEKYGKSNADIWDEIYLSQDNEPYYPGSDPQV